MRISAFAALTLVTIALAPPPAVAAYNLPWCAQFNYSNVLSCSFTSIEQCLATVSGVGGFCQQNFRYAGHPPAGARRAKRWSDAAFH